MGRWDFHCAIHIQLNSKLMWINPKLPALTIIHLKWFIDKCGCNNKLYNKWRYCATPSQPTSFWVHIFTLNWSPKRSRDKGCLTAGKKSFTVFCCRKLQRKRSKCEIFYLPGHWPAPFLSTVNDANQIILWWQP